MNLRELKQLKIGELAAMAREMGIENGKQGAAAVARFAKNVFSNDDLEDRSGTANEQTLRAFMAATV